MELPFQSDGSIRAMITFILDPFRQPDDVQEWLEDECPDWEKPESPGMYTLRGSYSKINPSYTLIRVDPAQAVVWEYPPEQVADQLRNLFHLNEEVIAWYRTFAAPRIYRVHLKAWGVTFALAMTLFLEANGMVFVEG